MRSKYQMSIYIITALHYDSPKPCRGLSAVPK